MYEKSWTTIQINIFIFNVPKLEATKIWNSKIFTKGLNEGSLLSVWKERNTQYVDSRTSLIDKYISVTVQFVSLREEVTVEEAKGKGKKKAGLKKAEFL